VKDALVAEARRMHKVSEHEGGVIDDRRHGSRRVGNPKMFADLC
jgi:hypothetical protein